MLRTAPNKDTIFTLSIMNTAIKSLVSPALERGRQGPIYLPMKILDTFTTDSSQAENGKQLRSKRCRYVWFEEFVCICDRDSQL